MAETDRRTIVECDITMSTLMGNAGTAVARFIERSYPEASRLLFLCGKGNNGGDGIVAAKVLAVTGHREITIAILGEVSDLKETPTAELRALMAAAPHVTVVGMKEGSLPEAESFDLIVDAIVGTGFKPPLKGLGAEIRDRVALLRTPVVAVDLPSGWDADSTEQKSPDAFRADAVVTFTAPKLAHVFGALTRGNVFGPVVVAGIGSPDAVIASSGNLHWGGASKTIAEMPRNVNSNKGKFGHVLLVGGSYGTAGAPSMSALAAMRTGAGLVTAAVPDSIVNLVAQIAPELMIAPLTQGDEGAVDLRNLDRLDVLMKRISVVAIGPGLSTKGEASEFARQLVAKTTVPMVIDADALNAFDVTRTHFLDGVGRTIVLTPHPGEFARLTGLTVKEVEADRINLARAFATKHQVTLVLKGWRTLIAHPDGSIAVNTTGNPSMAKGGSGDILTGIVAAMLAQFPDNIAEAVEAAVYLHGLAGDFAAHAMDEHTVLATDTVANLSDAFRYRTRDEDGFTWITGLNKR
ncbi:NAD(P)H-hydrate epimerase [Granulicella aggregans]|uniref:Bifunctional NAD(P)H-hydrate repair enzyme n=2 Tax=Granulicella aggregans TaxID=474949 RepID=A0A7W8E329_9BACT|nr:NAD(P)H-hydrate epimerase [Granulicella aggregans]